MSKQQRPKPWGDIYHAALRRGWDHGYAAWVADRYERRNETRRNMDSLENLFITIERPKAYNWKPQPDITAYELALAIPILSVHTFDIEVRIEALPERMRRHFEEVVEEGKYGD